MKSYQVPYFQGLEQISAKLALGFGPDRLQIRAEDLPLIKAWLIGKGYKISAEYPLSFTVNKRLRSATLYQAVAVTQEILSEPMDF
ncbi:hypothetical protein LCGC14_1715370 [marine sediment metagenome]|uniref:Uncharacterized protein n=1 Tax=marine sediment metagenome TaxID=412755 RepID=A0A0F9HDR7_9ZZZZ